MKAMLVCAPADFEFVVTGSTFDLSCPCGRRLMLAPAGQAFLKRHPEANVMCWPCYEADTQLTRKMPALVDDTGTITDRVTVDLRKIKRNMRRFRN